MISFPFSGQIKLVQVYLYWPNISLMVKLYWNYLVERLQLVFNSILIFFARSLIVVQFVDEAFKKSAVIFTGQKIFPNHLLTPELGH